MFNYSIPTIVLKSNNPTKGNLYVGGIGSLDLFQNYKIQAIVSAIEKVDKKLPAHIHHLLIQAPDEPGFDMSQHFKKSQLFIANHLQHTNVLVHCAVGISRSVTLVTAFMIMKTKQTPKQIIDELDKTRPGVGPNEGFMLNNEQKEMIIKITKNMNFHTTQADLIIDSGDKYKGNLFVGGYGSVDQVGQLNIGAVITAIRFHDIKFQAEITHLTIQADDDVEFQMDDYFVKATNFIKNHLQTTNVLVHCAAGISRSVSLCIAYFIQELKMTPKQALSIIKEKRPFAGPNSGFMRQLEHFYIEQKI